MARSFRSRCFNLLVFIKMSLCFYRWSSRQDADCFAALDVNNVEQTPAYRHPDDGIPRLAIGTANISNTETRIAGNLSTGFKGTLWSRMFVKGEPREAAVGMTVSWRW